MAKYGLKRGIKGSKAQHKSTSEHYRDLLEQTETLQEIKESVETDIENHIQKRDEIKEEYEEVKTKTEQKQDELFALKQDKAVQTVKNISAEVLGKGLSKISNLLDDKKAKEYERRIEGLSKDKEELKQENSRLKKELQNLYERFPFLESLQRI
ncbi:MAG: hypothetical protein LIO79_08155 [Rikenellaceae bacterium]|nr:hypothetical protein [Rikenellaceae bacterium]